MTDTLSDYHLERLGSHGGDFASIPLRIGANTIGRLPSNNIVLNSKYASRSHCTINVTETDHVTVKNDVATNGIFINGAQKLNRDTDECLNINDILGIGCDTSNEEISDEACFIFKLKRNVKSEENGADEIINLADSGDEEEDKMLEQYSQMNLSEMKQEWMDSEDVVEEYTHSRANLVINVPVKIDEKSKSDDVFEILANASKSYAEKSELIKIMEPDIGLILMKDVCVGKDDSAQLTKEREVEAKKHERRKSKNETRRERRKSTETKRDRNATRKASTAAKDESKISRSPPPRIRQLHFTIPLKNINDAIEPTIQMTDASSAQKVCLNNSTARILNRRNTLVPSTTSVDDCSIERSEASNKPMEVHAKILKRRCTFVPSSTLVSGSLKRSLEIIDAPHMLKRRKSVSVMTEIVKPTPKKKESTSKWLSKTVPHPHKRRSKAENDEIKSKLAAIAPKEKVVEPKIIRPNTKIPVKNTQFGIECQPSNSNCDVSSRKVNFEKIQLNTKATRHCHIC